MNATIDDEFGGLARIVNDNQPFGPIDTESVVQIGRAEADRLFDRANLVYAQARGPNRPTYIVGRKGAGKTAFLLAGTGRHPERLRTAPVYSEMVATLRCYSEHRGPIFVEQVSDIWQAVLDHVALTHACGAAAADERSTDDPAALQTVWDYVDGADEPPLEPATVAEHCLARLQAQIKDPDVTGLGTMIDGITRGGVTFGRARRAARDLLAARREPVALVMDNLEDLHARLDDVREALAGLFACVGRAVDEAPHRTGYRTYVCLPSELFASIQEISANPEKDFRGNYLTIYWTARELLHLAGSRLRVFLATQHPDELDRLIRRCPAAHPDAHDSEVALLRATLPPRVRGDLGVEEDPVAYLLRHTQLLPRHLLQVLNQVYGARQRDSRPWQVTPQAVLNGTHGAEELVVRGILAAHQQPYPFAGKVLHRLSDRLEICFTAAELHRVFNRQGIRKLTGMDFGEFLAMLFQLGVLGIRTDRTTRYHKVQFQYTFGSSLNPHEESSDLCFHPLFARFLYERSLPRLRRDGALPVYPYGCDPNEPDYRFALGYALSGGG